MNKKRSVGFLFYFCFPLIPFCSISSLGFMSYLTLFLPSHGVLGTSSHAEACCGRDEGIGRFAFEHASVLTLRG